MTGLLFFSLAVLLVAAVGLALAFFMKPMSGMRGYGVSTEAPSLTKTEFVVGLLIASLVVIPTTTWLGTKVAQANAVSYNEYWSGLEKSADTKTINCTKDGPCVHEYSCDPYVVMVTKTRQVPDGVTTTTHTRTDGTTYTTTTPKYRTETYQEPETRWRDCPYVQTEHSFTVTDTLGETYNFGSHLFPANAADKRWTGSGYERRSLPNVAQGIPADWTAVKTRLDAGEPGGTTKREKYKNYILASAEDIYEKHSDAIGDYKKAKLMPKPASTVVGHYNANKVYFVGATHTNAKDWQFALQRLNGYVGGERQGDMHLVLVDTSAVPDGDADRYSQALEAYWQSKELGKDTFSKNGIAVVLGVDGTEISWARGFTGMPVGNEELVQAFTNLSGEVATSEALLDPETGAIAAMVLEEGAGFVRVEMKNYEYLADSVKIGTGARILILLVAVILSMLIWGLMLAIDLRFHPIENFRRVFGGGDGGDADSFTDTSSATETIEETLRRYKTNRGYSGTGPQ